MNIYEKINIAIFLITLMGFILSYITLYSNFTTSNSNFYDCLLTNTDTDTMCKISESFHLVSLILICLFVSIFIAYYFVMLISKSNKSVIKGTKHVNTVIVGFFVIGFLLQLINLIMDMIDPNDYSIGTFLLLTSQILYFISLMLIIYLYSIEKNVC